jgi:soluble lytic murein transglycosylase-like protein
MPAKPGAALVDFVNYFFGSEVAKRKKNYRLTVESITETLTKVYPAFITGEVRFMFRWSFLVCVLLLLISSGNAPASEEPFEIGSSTEKFNVSLLAPADTAPKPIVIPSRFVPPRYAEMVLTLAAKHGVSWQLVAAVMKFESNFKSTATSSRGARGLMQLTPRTASRYKVSAHELYDPYKNIEAGVKHLKMLIDRYAGNLELAIAAYNTGEFAVDRHRGIPPFRTTRAFVKKVINQYLDWL